MKDGRALQKQNRGENQGSRAPDFKVPKFRTPDFKVRKFRTPQNQGAKSLAKGSNFRTPQFKVRNHSRCEIRFQGANFLKSNFAHHCGSVRKFRTPLFKVRKFRTPHFKVRIYCKGGHFRTPNSKVRNFSQGAKISHVQKLKGLPAHQLKPLESRTSTPFISAMAKTRGGLPPPHPHRHLDHTSRHGSRTSPPVQAPAIPPSEGEAPSQRRYPTGGHPRTLCHQRQPEPVLDPLQENQVLGSWRAIPCTSARASYRGTSDSSGHPPETVIRRPMIAGPPIEGNLDCRDRSFHSETYFDIEALRQQPELRDSFRLLQRRTQGAIGARHIAEALHIPYEPVFQADFREWSSFSQSDMVRILSRGTSTASVLTRRELPSGMLLIDVLLRANIFPFSIRKSPSEEASEGRWHPITISEAPLPDFRALGYPEEPRLERRRHCERTSLSTNGITWPSRMRFSQRHHLLPLQHTPQCTCLRLYIYLPITQGAPPVVPATPAPPPSSEPTVTVSLTEFRGLVRSLQTLSTAQDSIIHQMATIRAHQDQIIATQAQHTTILHQIQQHLSMQTLLGMIGLHHPSL
ncbi:hypothetical protein CK203_040392 [Vitis vinifera]|uniref:Uncharacterized protein n=1 Tax=Vitis vinifera TaxID=29760 RepID=A0A438FX10_VITVI|nr:hypothetical protein CK203_040392 [Vitis vinifera]